MAVDGAGRLVRLSETPWTLTKADDIRHRRVIDDDGEDQGAVDELFIDETEGRVRLLRVTPRGFIGTSECTWFISPDAITSITKENIQLDLHGKRACDRVNYDPKLVESDSRYTRLPGDHRCV